MEPWLATEKDFSFKRPSKSADKKSSLNAANSKTPSPLETAYMKSRNYSTYGKCNPEATHTQSYPTSTYFQFPVDGMFAKSAADASFKNYPQNKQPLLKCVVFTPGSTDLNSTIASLQSGGTYNNFDGSYRLKSQELEGNYPAATFGRSGQLDGSKLTSQSVSPQAGPSKRRQRSPQPLSSRFNQIPSQLYPYRCRQVSPQSANCSGQITPQTVSPAIPRPSSCVTPLPPAWTAADSQPVKVETPRKQKKNLSQLKNFSTGSQVRSGRSIPVNEVPNLIGLGDSYDQCEAPSIQRSIPEQPSSFFTQNAPRNQVYPFKKDIRDFSETLYDSRTGKQPPLTSRFKPSKPDHSVDIGEMVTPEKQLEEELLHTYQNACQTLPPSKPGVISNAEKELEEHLFQSFLNMNSMNIKHKPLATEIPKATGWMRNSAYLKEMPGDLSNWTYEEETCENENSLIPSRQPASPSSDHNYLDEQLSVPSWAKQVTVNTLNETLIFKDYFLESEPTVKKILSKDTDKGCQSYLNNLPDWVREHDGEKEYLRKLPSWVQVIDSSDGGNAVNSRAVSSAPYFSPQDMQSSYYVSRNWSLPNKTSQILVNQPSRINRKRRNKSYGCKVNTSDRIRNRSKSGSTGRTETKSLSKTLPTNLRENDECQRNGQRPRSPARKEIISYPKNLPMRYWINPEKQIPSKSYLTNFNQGDSYGSACSRRQGSSFKHNVNIVEDGDNSLDWDFWAENHYDSGLSGVSLYAHSIDAINITPRSLHHYRNSTMYSNNEGQQFGSPEISSQTDLIQKDVYANSDKCRSYSLSQPAPPLRELKCLAEPTPDKDEGIEDLICSFVKSPIETLDKIMAFITNGSAVDEEDLNGIQNFDEYQIKPFPWNNGGNFLAYVKEKHLKQGIAYCETATERMINQHSSNIMKYREEEMNCEGGEVMAANSVQVGIIEEVNQSDQMVEVIGYVGCTGNISDGSKNRKTCEQESEEPIKEESKPVVESPQE